MKAKHDTAGLVFENFKKNQKNHKKFKKNLLTPLFPCGILATSHMKRRDMFHNNLIVKVYTKVLSQFDKKNFNQAKTLNKTVNTCFEQSNRFKYDNTPF